MSPRTEGCPKDQENAGCTQGVHRGSLQQALTPHSSFRGLADPLRVQGQSTMCDALSGRTLWAASDRGCSPREEPGVGSAEEEGTSALLRRAWSAGQLPEPFDVALALGLLPSPSVWCGEHLTVWLLSIQERGRARTTRRSTRAQAEAGLSWQGRSLLISGLFSAL